jgi:hypothetical protein
MLAISSQYVAVVLLVFTGGIFLFSLPKKITQRETGDHEAIG